MVVVVHSLPWLARNTRMNWKFTCMRCVSDIFAEFFALLSESWLGDNVTNLRAFISDRKLRVRCCCMINEASKSFFCAFQAFKIFIKPRLEGFTDSDRREKTEPKRKSLGERRKKFRIWDFIEARERARALPQKICWKYAAVRLFAWTQPCVDKLFPW